jgi:hypothetical protein
MPAGYSGCTEWGTCFAFSLECHPKQCFEEHAPVRTLVERIESPRF